MQEIIELISYYTLYVFTVDSRSYTHTITSRISYADCRYTLLDDENTLQKNPTHDARARVN